MYLLSKIDICSKALLKVGANSISSFEEASSEAEIAAGFYEITKQSLLSSHPWSFATTVSRLPKMQENPLFGYKNVYALPLDMLRIISAGTNTREHSVDYKIYGKRIYSNVDELALSYIFDADESLFPAFFTTVLVAKLASEFSVAFFDSSSKSNFLENIAESEYRKAKLIDSQQSLPKYISDYPLIDVRG